MIDVQTLNKAIELTQNGSTDEAESMLLELLEKESENHILLSSLGLFYVNMREFEKATIYLKKACEIKETFGTVSALGLAEYENEDYQKASEILEYSLSYGETPEILHTLILSLFQIRDFQKLAKYVDLMYKKYPNEVTSVANKVKFLTQTGKLIEAESLCIDYLKENQNAAPLWFHLGFLKELLYCNDQQACECYKLASTLGAAEAYYNMAVSYQKMGDYVNAEKNYKIMLEKSPHSNITKVSLGMCYLLQKRFEEGYALIYNRKITKAVAKTSNLYKIGDKIANEVIVICEQGYGDHIQFIRYLPHLAQKVEKLTIACPKELKILFSENYPDYEFITHDEINPETQAMRITDLAYILGLDFDNIPHAEGYLNAPKAEITSDKLKVGFCWEAGSAGIRGMINRTINIKLFENIINNENIQLYSFQVVDSMNGNEKYPQIINLAKDFNDFYDTAKALKAMDVMVTVDTAVAHLAGALGVKTFLLLPYSADWRWFNDTKTTPWYKSIEIFKQSENISWEKELREIECKLNEFSL